MTQLTTITSKKQLTLPAALFKKAGLKEGQKVIVSEENGRLIITPAEILVEELAGSLATPQKWQGKTIDEVIQKSKMDYFSNQSK